MGLFKGFRQGAEERVTRDLGVQPGLAQLTGLALHPFADGDPRPQSRDFEQFVRRTSRDFSRSVRRVRTPEELLEAARATVQPWYHAAKHLQERHYCSLFGDALEDATPVDGDRSYLAIFGMDPLREHARRARHDVAQLARELGTSSNEE